MATPIRRSRVCLLGAPGERVADECDVIWGCFGCHACSCIGRVSNGQVANDVAPADWEADNCSSSTCAPPDVAPRTRTPAHIPTSPHPTLPSLCSHRSEHLLSCPPTTSFPPSTSLPRLVLSN